MGGVGEGRGKKGFMMGRGKGAYDGREKEGCMIERGGEVGI